MRMPSRAVPSFLFLFALGVSFLFWEMVGGPDVWYASEAAARISDFSDVLLLRNYNTRLVVLSTTLLGISAGMVGSFLLLRKRALMGDVMAHACLPGIVLAFVLLVRLGHSGMQLGALLAGAVITGLLGVWLVLLIRRVPRLHDDVAMGIILSVFFGFGIMLIGLIQNAPGAATAGIHSFIYGKTASLIRMDFFLIASAAILVLVITLLLQKEMTLLCFDEAYARTLGWNVLRLDMTLLLLVSGVTVVGLQAVGLILIVAFLIIPAAAARFWTNDIRHMQILAGVIGGGSGWLGSSMSALLPRLPAGAVIVLGATVLFFISLLFGGARGIVKQLWHARCLRRQIAIQDLLRAVFELQELEGTRRNGYNTVSNIPVSLEHLLAKRSWTERELLKTIRFAQREGLASRANQDTVQISEAGFGEAARFTHNHRLWMTYLLTNADTAPQYVDRDADTIEHILSPYLIRELEAEIVRRGQVLTVPPVDASSRIASAQTGGV